MKRTEKRKQPVDKSKLFVGAKVYVWDGYPYSVRVATITRDTKIHWVCDNGKKYAKATCNESGFSGLSGNFIEPITEESEQFAQDIILRGELFLMMLLPTNRFSNKALEEAIKVLKNDIIMQESRDDEQETQTTEIH